MSKRTGTSDNILTSDFTSTINSSKWLLLILSVTKKDKKDKKDK